MANKALTVLLLLALVSVPAASQELFVAVGNGGDASEVIADLGKCHVFAYTNHEYTDWRDTEQYLYGAGVKHDLGLVSVHAGLAVINDKITTHEYKTIEKQLVKVSRVTLDETKVQLLIGVAVSKQAGKSTYYLDCIWLCGPKAEARYGYRVADTVFTISYVYAPEMQVGGVKVGVAAPI